MKEFKCRWNVNATQEEYPCNIPKWLPELVVLAENKATALYTYQCWLKEEGNFPNENYIIPPLEEYLKQPFSSGGWGLFADEV